MEYYGIYDNTVKRWIVDGNTIVYYPSREIAEAHLQMVKSKNNDFVVKMFLVSHKSKNK